MPSYLPAFLLVLFSIHFLVFLGLWIRARQLKHLLISGTFLLLVVSWGLRVFDPGLAVLGLQATWVFRVLAWVMAAVALFYSQVVLRRRNS